MPSNVSKRLILTRVATIIVVICLIISGVYVITRPKLLTGGGYRYYTPVYQTFNSEYIQNEYLETQGFIIEECVYAIYVGNLSLTTQYKVVFGNKDYDIYNKTYQCWFDTVISPFYLFKFVKQSKLDLGFILILAVEFESHE